MHLSQQFVVGSEVVDERAAEAQAVHQGAHLSLQGTASIHLRAKGLRDAEVFPQDDHVHLETDVIDHETHSRESDLLTSVLITDECFNVS